MGSSWDEDPPDDRDDFAPFHPSARTLLPDDFFWDCDDYFSPVGNDDGADVLVGYLRWRLTHPWWSPASSCGTRLPDGRFRWIGMARPKSGKASFRSARNMFAEPAIGPSSDSRSHGSWSTARLQPSCGTGHCGRLTDRRRCRRPMRCGIQSRKRFPRVGCANTIRRAGRLSFNSRLVSPFTSRNGTDLGHYLSHRAFPDSDRKRFGDTFRSGKQERRYAARVGMFRFKVRPEVPKDLAPLGDFLGALGVPARSQGGWQTRPAKQPEELDSTCLARGLR